LDLGRLDTQSHKAHTREQEALQSAD